MPKRTRTQTFDELNKQQKWGAYDARSTLDAFELMGMGKPTSWGKKTTAGGLTFVEYKFGYPTESEQKEQQKQEQKEQQKEQQSHCYVSESDCESDSSRGSGTAEDPIVIE